jgi:hypothetical protein
MFSARTEEPIQDFIRQLKRYVSVELKRSESETYHFLPVSKLRMSGAIHLPPRQLHRMVLN